jgi:alkylation response protein AidB-like acyl-CoA dehydrogenase
MKSPYFSEEHEMLRDQVRRLVKAEIMPHGDQWERDGMTPRSLLRKMGALGLLGLRFPTAAPEWTFSAGWCSPRSSAAQPTAA